MRVIAKGTLFRDQFRIEEKLGEGGMAWVYRAQHIKLGHEVAIKILYPHLASDLSIRERFMSEAQIQSQMNHPNIARVIDMIDEQGLFGFVMEWCNAQDLRLWMRDEKMSPTPDQWRALFLPVVRAMTFAHEEGYVHRDLKPSNVLLDRHKDVLTPKVGDFGIAKILGVTGRTRTGSLMGTLVYMSPEQVEDSKQIDHRSDIYSLGVMMYELATGRLPYEETGPSVVLQIFREPPLDPIEAPKSLQPIILKCLEKDPADRFQDGHELEAALERALTERKTKRWSRIDYPSTLWERGETSGIASALADPTPPKGALEATVATAFGEEGLPDSIVKVLEDSAFAATAEADVSQLTSGGAATDSELPVTQISLGETAKDTPVHELSGPTERAPTAPHPASGWRHKGMILLVLFLLGVATAALWELDPFGLRAPTTGKALSGTPPVQHGADAGAPDARTPAPRWSQVTGKAPAGRPPTARILSPPVLHPGQPGATRPGARATDRREPPGTKGPADRRVAARLPTPRGGSDRPAPPQEPRRPGPRPSVRPGPSPRRGAVGAKGMALMPRPAPTRRTEPAQRRTPTRRPAPTQRTPSARRQSATPCPEQSKALCQLWRQCHSQDAKAAGKACVSIGLQYANGRGVRRDRKRAAMYYQQGCRRKNLNACTNLGFYYARGWGVKKSYTMAHQLYQKACDGGYMRGCSNRGVLFSRGIGGPARPARANALYRKACHGRYARGCLFLGFNLSKGRGGPLSKRAAVALYEKACSYGYGRGCWWAGSYIAKGRGVAVDFKRANALFRKACQKKFGWGCRDLGISYELGRQLPANMTKANQYYRQADKLLRRGCRKRSAKACYWAGLAYAEGRGVRYDCTIANRFYKKACRLGDKRGCRRRCVTHTIPSHQPGSDMFQDPPSMWGTDP